MLNRSAIVSNSQRFVPDHILASASEIADFRVALSTIDKLLVLTGAGISTESCIPDYRSEKVGQIARAQYRPITYQQFIADARVRQRYWARNYVSWPTFRNAQCNVAHRRLVEWQTSNRLHWLITQNVDNLHRLAGATSITELHGSGHRVRCLNCGALSTRDHFQKMIKDANPNWTITDAVEMAPDGDVHLNDAKIALFTVPHCIDCGPTTGIMQTDVVFFGDNVRRAVVEECERAIDASDGMLVIGSSLQVFSAMRCVLRMHRQQKPILIVNIGKTRADELALRKIESRCSDVLMRIDR